MKKVLLIVLTVLIYLKGYSQKKISHGLMISPSIEQFTWPNHASTSLVGGFHKRLSYNFGLKSSLHLSKKISLTSGLIVYNKGRIYYVSSVPVAKLTNHLWFLTIPLTVDCKLPLSDKFSISSTIGVTYGRKVWEYYFQDYDDRHFYRHISSGVAKNHLGATLGIGAYYQLTNRVAVDIKPTYIRQLNSGWDTKYGNNKARFDSYLLEFTIWYQSTKRNNR